MRIISGLVIGLGLASVLLAQPPQRADLENTIELLERQVAAQQDRVSTVTEKLKATDEQIERRIDRVLQYLVTVTDSQDSRTKVLTAKQDIFDGLKRNIEFYGRERGQRFAALYRPSSRAAKEGLAADVTWLNDRIEKRVGQALSLVASLPAEKDVPKYKTYYDGGDWHRRTDSAYSHQHRTLAISERWRDAVFADLKTSIDRIKRSHAELERALAAAKTDDGRKFVRDLLERNEALVVKRQEQIQTALDKVNPAARALGGKAADALVEQILEERTNNKKDIAEWIRLKNERDLERERLDRARDLLAVHRAALKDMSVKQ